MLLTIKTTQSPATDLGYLLHKNPSKYHEFSLPFGKAHVFFSEVESANCKAALLLEIDPITLVRKAKGFSNEGFSLKQYVNDRPYVASSFLSVAIAKVFRSALKGVCKEKPELLEYPIPLEASIAALPSKCQTGSQLLKSLFEPLGYEVAIQDHLLDEKYPHWGKARHHTVTIKKKCFLKDLLSHIYVLIPVLDNEKHYWITETEIEKLLSFGKGWLNEHPQKELIVTRYLKRQRDLTHTALAKLIGDDETEIEQNEENLTLQKQRMQDVVNVLKTQGARRIADIGCGEGALIKHLLADQSFDYILGVDVSYNVLERAKRKLQLDRLQPTQLKRIDLVQGSLNYTDQRIVGFDAITLVEVIEHLDLSRLFSLEYVIFGFAKPKVVVITTPNSEYNEVFEELPAGTFRHTDHRFEWSREEFQSWADNVAGKYGYTVNFQEIGPKDLNLGSPTQMAVFKMQESG